MGFGTLFIGYFLILNLTYYGITDIIAAAIMLLGLYKLSEINKWFKTAATVSGIFCVFALGELGITFYEMLFKKIDSSLFISSLSILRCLIIGALTAVMLKALATVAKEVDVADLPTKCTRMMYISGTVYALWILLELPLSFINGYVLAVTSLITIFATIILIIVNLTIIYSCYMHICMPGDENVMKDKPSKFNFVNEYRARKEEQARQEAEERLKKLQEKLAKKGKKK